MCDDGNKLWWYINIDTRADCPSFLPSLKSEGLNLRMLKVPAFFARPILRSQPVDTETMHMFLIKNRYVVVSDVCTTNTLVKALNPIPKVLVGVIRMYALYCEDPLGAALISVIPFTYNRLRAARGAFVPALWSEDEWESIEAFMLTMYERDMEPSLGLALATISNYYSFSTVTVESIERHITSVQRG